MMVSVLFGAKPEALSETVSPAFTGLGDRETDGFPPDGAPAGFCVPGVVLPLP